METRMEKWAEKRRKIEMAMVMLNDRLTMLENRVDELDDTTGAVCEAVKYLLDTHEVSAKAFDDMFDDPLDTLEEVFKI